MKSPLRTVILCLLMIDAMTNVYAQADNALVGARATGMGNASVTMTDAWSILNNIAGMTGMEQTTAFATYENRFGFAPFQTLGIGAVAPLSSTGGVVGASISRFGDELYNELKIGIGYAHKIDMVSLGLKINYLQVYLQDLGSRGSFVFELGGLVDLSPEISFGASIYNFSQSSFTSEFAEDEPVPVIMKAGLSYTPSEVLLMILEVEKDIDYPASIRAGLEYQIIKGIYGRTGIRTAPFDLHFGGGISVKKWIIDLALTTQNNLGTSYTFSLGYQLGKKSSIQKKQP